MVRSTNHKDKYMPVEKIGDSIYYIRWAPTPVMEHKLNELTGEMEIVGETDLVTYTLESFNRVPRLYEIKNMILNWYNEQVDYKILYGFKWNDMPVWLSTENQFNYKAAYDIAIQTGGKNLPIKFKFGTTENPQYHTFETLEDLTNFYMSAMTYINNCLNEGWEQKDAINWDDYVIEDENTEA